MKQQINRPNIFKVSTKELSQDAFITWLIQWANPQCAELDSILHDCGKSFLSLLMGDAPEKEKTIASLNAGRQWEYIDVWAEIFFKDGTKTLLVIEDKTFSGPHSNQLERYKRQAEDYCETKKFNNLICTYFKIGSESLEAINAIKDKGFHIVNRKQIIACLQPYRKTEHTILRDFIEYIDDLEEAHLSFEKLPPKDWEGLAWVGFYQFVESNLKIITWHWINNPNGGFWNLCLTWQYWNNNIPVYMQIEQQKLCFKIALGEDETDLENDQKNLNVTQDFVNEFLINFAQASGLGMIKHPSSFVHRGNYRTLAVINLEDWCGNPEYLVDKYKIIVWLRGIISFYKDFMNELNKISFESKGIKILEYQGPLPA